MLRLVGCLACFSISFAQVPVAHQQEPFDAAIQAYWAARNEGRFDSAAANREEARKLLDQTPVDEPQFAGRVQGLAHIYQQGGKHAQARAIVQQSLSRASDQTNPSRVMLLSTLGDFWQQDQNLLKALEFREKAITVAEATPPGKTSTPYARVQQFNGVGVSVGGLNSPFFHRVGSVPGNTHLYQALTDLYQQLGRPEAVAKTLTRMRALLNSDDAALASFYERQGQLDEAAAIYKKQAEQAAANPQTEPWQLVAPLQALSGLYQREQRYDEAAAAIQQAIAGLEASGKPEAHNQTIWMRQNLANILNQGGQTQAADQIYQQLLTDTPGNVQVLTGYANHLAATKRGAQAEDLLNDYLKSHSGLQPQEETNLLYALANVARMSGQSQRAEDYQRAAQQKQQPAQTTPPGQIFVAADLHKAQSAAQAGNIDEAFNLALQAMDAASRAVDRDQVPSMVQSIASALATKKAEDKGEQLYQRLFALVQGWSAETMQPLMNASQSYTHFLMQQPHRWNEVSAAIQRHHDTVIASFGAETGGLAEVLRLTIQFERGQGSQVKALSAAQDLLALEESLSGTTSEPYLRAVETLADVSEPGDSGHVLALRRQAVAIADLVFPSRDDRRGQTRINAAFALARQQQFDEADRLANEAVAIAQEMRPPQPNMFASQLAQIQRMKTAPQPGSGASSTGSNRAFRSGQWVEKQTPPGTPGSNLTGILGETPIAAPPPPKPAPVKQQ
jgi:hypothetical protein